MALHRKVDKPDDPDVDINPIYVQEAGHEVVPAYTLPDNLTGTAVMRIVVRNGFSRDLADVFLADLLRDSRALAAHPRAHTPLAPEPFRQGFAH
jgi:hypothetical protein